MSYAAIPAPTRASPSLADWLSRHWLDVFLVVYGLWVFLPFLAPALMHIGWSGGGKVLYLVYSLFCHQLPERSFFLFGYRTMYSLPEIQAAWQNTDNPFILRKFIGSPEMGWKVAWSDRMVSFYGGIWLFALLWAPIRRRVSALPWWGLLLLLIPIFLDGATHVISDVAGIGAGFRDTNLWLAALTNHALAASFYAGDALGTFNSWMRLLTGLLAALGIVWFGFPYVEEAFGKR
jgi:uncharacterized membrane protein